MDELGKLSHLLEHWIEHNEEHAKEFQDWAMKAKDSGAVAVAENILQAVKHLEAANKSLSDAASALPAGHG